MAAKVGGATAISDISLIGEEDLVEEDFLVREY